MKRKMIMSCLVALLLIGTSVTANASELKNSQDSSTTNAVVSETVENKTVNAKEENNVEIKRNWVTEEVAKQLKKDVSEVKYEDFSKITKLDLRYQRIDDKIPEEISYMKNLQYLDLNYCRLYGSIPEELAQLENLKYLDLGDNKLQEIPDNLMKKIKENKYTYIDVEGNHFELPEGFYILRGKQCYLDRNGQRIKGENNIEGQDYIFDSDGNLKDGFDKVDGKTYYYDGKKGLVKNDWKLLKDKYYYFDKDGVMLTGWQTINGKKYYLNKDGVMVTGLQTIDDKTYYFSTNGDVQNGLITTNGHQYYFDDNTNVMLKDTEKNVNGTTYKIDSNGYAVNKEVIDGNTPVNSDGEPVNITSNMCHSNTNYNAYKYMTDKNNRVSVHYRAIQLHGGDTSNNCVFFTSEVLRRIGVNLALSTCNTYELEGKLQNLGFVSCYDLSQLKPGDIVFTNGYTHVYIFMFWDKNGYAYIVDNQEDRFDNKVLHLRQIYSDTALTDRATHFYYLPY